MSYISKITVFLLLFVCGNSIVFSQEKKDNTDEAIAQEKFSYRPELGGTIRAKFEYEPEIDGYRFQVRNARISLKGWVAPVIDYKAEVDLCDRGDTKVLDVYGRFHFKNQGSITLGQMRVPFGTDVTRSPHMLYFANRSCVAKQIANVRDVGVKFMYSPSYLPISVEAGVYNGTGLTNQQVWRKDFSFAGRVSAKYKGFKLEISGLSIIPDSVRINLFDVSLSWKYKRIFIEGEYVHKHYTNDSFKSVDAYNFLAIYQIPLNMKVFNYLNIGARFDAMGNHSSGVRNDIGDLIIDNVARKRLTIGGTLCSLNKINTELRVNYEKYFYDDDVLPSDSDRDKLVIELMVHF